VGSVLLKYLSSRGVDACGLIRETSDRRRLAGAGLQLRYADILDYPSLLEVFSGCERVIHCAALSSDWGSYEDFHSSNVTGTANVVNAAARCGAERIVHMSSANVAGYGSRDMVEEGGDYTRLPFPYTRTKREGEKVVEELCAERDVDYVILRPSAIYGPGDWKWSFVLIDRLARSYWPLVNHGRAVFTPLYVDNLCRALDCALETDRTGEVFNVTDDAHISWYDMCREAASALGEPLRVKNFSYSFGHLIIAGSLLASLFSGDGDGPAITRYKVVRSARDFHYSCRRAKDLLGYSPDRDIASHIRDTVAWYRAVTSETRPEGDDA
jgi:nucleoside-diphosphate-sugar epimerase